VVWVVALPAGLPTETIWPVPERIAALAPGEVALPAATEEWQEEVSAA
jgi:hypothetical protein